MFDFVSFAVHVGLHRSDALWNVHKVHHSTLHLDGFATTRTHMFENMLRFVPGQAVLFLIGMSAAVVAPVVAIAAIYGVSNHSNLGMNLRWVEALLVTPRLHRRHHVPVHDADTTSARSSPSGTDCFGTLVRTDTTPDERYGVPGEIDTYPQRFLPAFRNPILQLRQQRADKTRSAATDQQ